jgi:hypothetical protein
VEDLKGKKEKKRIQDEGRHQQLEPENFEYLGRLSKDTKLFLSTAQPAEPIRGGDVTSQLV